MSIVKPKVFWPLSIISTNRNIAIQLTGAPFTEYTATIAQGTYTSAVSLAAAVQTAIQAVGGGAVFNNMVVSVDSTGHFVFTDSLDPAFSFDWNRAAFTNSAVSLLGFFAINYDSAANVVTAPKQHTNGWYSPTAVREDSLPIRDRGADTITVALSGQTKFITETELVKRRVRFAYLPPEKTYSAFEGSSTNVNQAIENWWLNGRAKFRYWPDGTDEATTFDYVLGMDSIEKFEPTRMFIKKGLYEIGFDFRGYVA